MNAHKRGAKTIFDCDSEELQPLEVEMPENAVQGQELKGGTGTMSNVQMAATREYHLESSDSESLEAEKMSRKTSYKPKNKLTVKSTEQLEIIKEEGKKFVNGSEALQNTILSEKDRDLYTGLLLRMIDEGRGDFLPYPLPSPELRAFLLSSIYALCPNVNQALESFGDHQWPSLVYSLLEAAPTKRKDQKLRMVYNSILKMIINSHVKTMKRNNVTKFEVFVQNYIPSQKDDLKAMILSTKAPSKKKLKVLFAKYPELKREFFEILSKEIFLREYLRKRITKSHQIIKTFLELYRKHPMDPKTIGQKLSTTFKAFPWPVGEITSGCNLLLSVCKEGSLPSPTDSAHEEQDNTLSKWLVDARPKLPQPVVIPTTESRFAQDAAHESIVRRILGVAFDPSFAIPSHSFSNDKVSDFSFIFRLVECPYIK